MPRDLKIVVYRILGNDLPPRHVETQTYDNLKLMLEHEPTHENVEKRFLLNRIWNSEKFEQITAILESAGYPYAVIPFDVAAYKTLDSDTAKFNYLTNVNPARNFCIDDGFERYAHYVGPLDGACAFRRDGLENLVQRIKSFPALAYTLEMWRGIPHDLYLGDHDFTPRRREDVGSKPSVKISTEPQLILGNHPQLRFNESLPYGRVDKVELLWKLGVRGAWDAWEPEIYRITPKNILGRHPPTASYVCRLSPAGQFRTDLDIVARSKGRRAARPVLLRTVAKHFGLTGT